MLPYTEEEKTQKLRNRKRDTREEEGEQNN